jgi:hypothetical protein
VGCADIARVEVVTRPRGHLSTYRKVLQVPQLPTQYMWNTPSNAGAR